MEDNLKEQYTPISSSFNFNEERLIRQQSSDQYSDLNYRLFYPQIIKNLRSSNTRNSSAKIIDNAVEDITCDSCVECNESSEPYCHVKLDSIIKLKDSTKKLLFLLDEIQSKTHSKDEILTLDHFVIPKQLVNNDQSSYVSDSINIPWLKKLEKQANNLEAIYVPEEEDDCSIYKRLTRKCHCLNQEYYNDFIIHFNEETKYSTSNIGEIIKNMRILKKFLYMGGAYTNNALMFLNEGLSDIQPTEKIEIIQGCSHADICNVFGEHSIVITCISWPCKNDFFGGASTQSLAAGILYKLAEIEEGRRYLNFSTKITNDIKKVLRKKSAVLDIDTIYTLKATLDSLKPPFAKNLNVTYLSKSVYEGYGYKTVNDLVKSRQYMTLDELLTHLELLKNFSSNDNGKTELAMYLPSIVDLFKNMLIEFDNSEMNIIITQILHNIVSKNMVKKDEKENYKVMTIADTATEPIKMRNEIIQMPPKQKGATKKVTKQKMSLGTAPSKKHQPTCPIPRWEPSGSSNRSRKFRNDLRSSIIVVPIEKLN